MINLVKEILRLAARVLCMVGVVAVLFVMANMCFSVAVGLFVRGTCFLILCLVAALFSLCISVYVVAKQDWSVYPKWVFYGLALLPVVSLWLGRVAGGGKIPMGFAYMCGYCFLAAILVFYAADLGERSRRLRDAAEDRFVRDRLERLRNFKLRDDMIDSGERK